MTIDPEKVDEIRRALLAFLEESEVDGDDAMAACADVIVELAQATNDPEMTLDAVVRRME